MRVGSIETTYVALTKRTVWRVVVAGEVQHTGHVVGDPAGVLAFAEASAWIVANGLEPGEWRHATDRAGRTDSTPPSLQRGDSTAPPIPRASSPETAIETTHHHARQQTSWRVIVDREVIAKGIVACDPTGALAQDVAERHLAQLSLGVTRWSHASDRTPSGDELLLGVVRCASGEELWVAVTDAQREGLGAGTMLCPVCGECCSPRFEVSDTAGHFVFAWNGTRWSGVERS